MSTFRLYFRALFGIFFLQVFLEQNCNGKKDPCAVFACVNDRLFPEKYTMKDHITNTKLDGLWVVSFCGFIRKIYSFNTPH